MEYVVAGSRYGGLAHVRPLMRPSREIIHDIVHCWCPVATGDGRVIPVHGEGYNIAVQEYFPTIAISSNSTRHVDCLCG